MSDQQSIQISIADRYYPLKVSLQDEEKIRAVVKIINDKVDLYRKRFTNRDIQDALSITLLQFVIRLIEAEQREESSRIVEEIQNISNLLDEYISVNLS